MKKIIISLLLLVNLSTVCMEDMPNPHDRESALQQLAQTAPTSSSEWERLKKLLDELDTPQPQIAMAPPLFVTPAGDIFTAEPDLTLTPFVRRDLSELEAPTTPNSDISQDPADVEKKLPIHCTLPGGTPILDFGNGRFAILPGPESALGTQLLPYSKLSKELLPLLSRPAVTTLPTELLNPKKTDFDVDDDNMPPLENNNNNTERA